VSLQAVTPAPRTVGLIIIGGGFAGIGMAIRLRQRGLHDFVILERANDLGGTWRDNQYPGCACDVQSSLYSFSFAPNPDWSRVFAPQSEIWSYLRRCVETHRLAGHFSFNEEVTHAAWSEDRQQWDVTSTSATWRAPVIVSASGALSDPVLPLVPGIESFAGRAFHSAHWDHTHDVRGSRVAVIGTGASAIQFVPHIQPVVQQLHLVQRTPPWIMPRNDHAIPAWRRTLNRRVPAIQRLERALLYAQREAMFLPFRHPAVARIAERLARKHLHDQVSDPALRAVLTPDYRIGCKRVLLSDDFYPAITQPNVEVLGGSLAAVHPHAIELADGTRRDVDTIIFGTGFRPTDPPIATRVFGRHGRSLADVWTGSPRAYLGTTEAGFPNLFMLLGPNTGLGHSSVLLMIEAQLEHVLGVLDRLSTLGASAAEPTAAAQDRHVRWIDARLASTVWNRGGCASWYLDRTGRNSTLWPERVGRFRRMVSRVRPEDYIWSDIPG